MRLVWSPEAQSDLIKIQTYYQRLNPQATRKLVRRILEAASLLEEFPQIGKQNKLKSCRMLQVTKTSYVLPYRITGDVIDIMAVFDQRQDRPDYLQ